MITALIRLTRPYYSLPLSCGLLVISLYVAGGDIRLIGGVKAVCSFSSLFFILSGAYTLNDVCDHAVDVINNPDRMIPKGQVTQKTALFSTLVLFVSGIGLSLFCGWKFSVILILIMIGLIFYDLYSKRMGLFKDILAAVLTTSLYPLAFSLTEPSLTPRLKSLYIFPVWLFLTTTGYEMLKDVRDIKGDSAVRDFHHMAYCSDPRFLRSAKVILMTASLLTVLPYFLGYCSHLYWISSLFAIVLVMLSLRQDPFKAIQFVYAEVFIITAGSWVDLLVYGP